MRATLTPDSNVDAENRKQLELLQAQLSSRKSIFHFAHSAISMVLALILAGAAAKLFWEVGSKMFVFAIPVGAAAISLGTYSTVRYLVGKNRLQTELARFADLKRLRRALNVDDPSALLPP